MSDQLTALRDKLNSAISQRKTIENTRQEQVRVLCQFIAKMSLTCKGMDIKLDNRLAQFRKLLLQGGAFEDLSPVIDELNTLLTQLETSQRKQLISLHASLKHTAQGLQQRKGLSEQNRRALRQLLAEEIEQAHTPLHFIPLLQSVLNMYEQLNEFEPKHQNSSADQKRQSIEALGKNLMSLSSEITLEGELLLQLKTLQEGITKATDSNQLLTISMELIRLIVLSLTKERQSAQHFLSALNQSLQALQQVLQTTNSQSKQLDERVQGLYQQIDENITQLSEQTSKAADIDQLKHIVETRLGTLSEQLEQKEALEQEQRHTLNAGLKSMQSRIVSLEDEVAQYEQTLEQQRLISLQDTLTRLPNRLAFDERLAAEMQHFKQRQQPLTLVVLDVDHFKSINDNYGHSAGDKTLQVIASTLKKCIRSTDFIARYGGEEFVLVMPNINQSDALKPLNKLRQTVKNIPFKFKDKQVQITVSIGITQVQRDDDALSAFNRADNALYQAKHAGRDRVMTAQ